MVEIQSKDEEKPKTSATPTVDQIISDRITQVFINKIFNFIFIFSLYIYNLKYFMSHEITKHRLFFNFRLYL